MSKHFHLIHMEKGISPVYLENLCFDKTFESPKCSLTQTQILKAFTFALELLCLDNAIENTLSKC